MTNTLGIYLSNHHDWGSTFDYMRALDPAWVNIHQPNARDIHKVQQAAPNARIMLRSWDIDDHNGDRKREMYADPRGAAHKHKAMWMDKLMELAAELNRNGWRHDPSKWYLGLVNEPDPAHIAAVVEYSLEAMRIAGGHHFGVVASSVGTFQKPSEGAHGWTKCVPLEKPINDGGHILLVHEYWQPEGPTFGEDAGNLAWRHHSIPLDVPILIRESGANGYIYGRHSQHDDAGWRKFMSPDQYAAQVREYIAGCDKRVQGVCLYMTDYHSVQWESFDTTPAHSQLLAIKDTRPQKPSPFAKPPVDTHIPSVIAPGPTPVEPPQEPSVPTLAHPIADPALRVVSQVFGVNPDRYAKFGMAGHNGVDYAVPTGTPIYAVDDGEVVESSFDADGYGEYIKMRHAWGESIYAHLKHSHFLVGAQVGAGGWLGVSGNTGNSTGPHLHFGLRVTPYTRGWPFDGYTDPMPYLEGKAQPTTQKDIVKAICSAALEFDVDPDLLLSQAWAESSFNPKAVSHAGAQGIMQIMPNTWREWAPKVGASDPFDVTDSARVGAAYMKWLIDATGGLQPALVAYGWGIGNYLAKKHPIPDIWAQYANKIMHGFDLLKAMAR